MKTCICLSGHFRTFYHTYNNFIHNIVEPLQKVGDVSIVASTWDSFSHKDSWQGGLGNKQNEEKLSQREIDFLNQVCNKVEIENYDEIKSQFLVSNFIENYTIFDSRRYSEDGKILNFIPLWYKVWKSNELKKQIEKENNFKFDIVVRCRFDAYYPHLINIEQILSEKWILYVGKECYFTEYSKYPLETGLNLRDMFCCGDSYAMDAYSELYVNLPNLLKKQYNEVSERILAEHIANIRTLRVKTIFEDVGVWR